MSTPPNAGKWRARRRRPIASSWNRWPPTWEQLAVARQRKLLKGGKAGEMSGDKASDDETVGR